MKVVRTKVGFLWGVVLCIQHEVPIAQMMAGGGGLGSPVGNSFMPKLKHLRTIAMKGNVVPS